MAEYIEREALIREISSDMTLFIGDPDAVQKHDEQCNYAISCVEDAPAVKPEPNWIPVSERLPEEHDSIFMRFYGTEKWKEGMFKKVSDEVNVTIEYVNGSKKVTHCKTHDGKWNISSIFQATITHWMPLPKPPEDTE